MRGIVTRQWCARVFEGESINHSANRALSEHAMHFDRPDGRAKQRRK